VAYLHRALVVSQKDHLVACYEMQAVSRDEARTPDPHFFFIQNICSLDVPLDIAATAFLPKAEVCG